MGMGKAGSRDRADTEPNAGLWERRIGRIVQAHKVCQTSVNLDGCQRRMADAHLPYGGEVQLEIMGQDRAQDIGMGDEQERAF
jgi:hypothetical protein